MKSANKYPKPGKPLPKYAYQSKRRRSHDGGLEACPEVIVRDPGKCHKCSMEAEYVHPESLRPYCFKHAYEGRLRDGTTFTMIAGEIDEPE